MHELHSLIPRVPAPDADFPERDDPRDGSGSLARGAAPDLAVGRPKVGWSQPAAAVLAEFMNPHPQVGLRWDLVTPGVEAEAKRHLQALRERAAIATETEWRRFLRRVAAMTANPPMGGAFDAFAHEVCTVSLRGYSIGALVDGMAECQCEEYFPKPAALKRVLGPLHRNVLTELSAAENMARGDLLAKRRAEEARKNPPPTDEQRAAVRIRVEEAERLRGEQAAAQRAALRETMAAMRHRQPTHRERVVAMEQEADQLDRAIRTGGGSAQMRERLDQLRLRLTNIHRAEEGERPFTVSEWGDRRRPHERSQRA